MTDALRDAIAKALPCNCGMFETSGMHHWDCVGRYHEAVADAIEPVIRSEVEAASQKAFEEAAVALENSYSIGENTQQGCIAIVRQLGVSGK